jgi:hypothetical protein
MDAVRTTRVNVQIGTVKIRQPFGLPSGRYRWTHIPGVFAAAMAIVTGAFAFAAEPWMPTCHPIAAVPMALASLLFLVGAELMLRPKPPFSRYRDSGVIQAGWLALTGTMIFSILSDQTLAWPVLYPVFMLPIALPIVGILGLSPASRLSIDDERWRQVIAIALILAAAMLVAGAHPYQSQIACQWKS